MRVFYFNITYRCNSSCLFCAADHPLLHSAQEMTCAEFERILSENNVCAEDRVIVNGGEPTLHREFFSILDAIQRRNATIDLFSNGTRFGDAKFLERLLNYDRFYIRVPLFGGDAKTHDYLTGHPGGFETVARGLDALCCRLPEKNTLEIKLLLSKYTIRENEKIFELAEARWKRENVKLSLNPLLISHCVVQHKDLFIDRYSTMMKASESLIRRAYQAGWKLSMDLIPYCAFPDGDLLALCHGTRRVESHYADPNASFTKKDDKKSGACQECRYLDVCAGFSKGYINYFGEEEKKPIRPQRNSSV